MYFTGILLTFLLLAVYSLLILQYRKWYLQLVPFDTDLSLQPRSSFSVVIPARNEAANIAGCLRTILQQNYPSGLSEVIVVNDHSTDNTASIIRSLQQEYTYLKLIDLEDHLQGKPLNAYKKKAIEVGIAAGTGNWVVTTDADCQVSGDWLLAFDSYIQKQDPVFIAAPVMFTNDGSFLSIFQLLDFMSLQGITAAAVSAGYYAMCNGANLAYRKDVFYEVGQFRGIDSIASGDDMLLMHKIKEKYPAKMGYLFSQAAIVKTTPMPDWKSFFNQRIRWASKADRYQDAGIFWTLALVYALNACLLVLLPVSLLITGGMYYWLLLVFFKTIIELSLMLPVSRFYAHTKELYWFPVMQPFHIVYTVIAGWLGKFGSYQWKGRSVQ
ncbi:MAG: glycosyltransferase [Sediminibacterium sp.]